MRPLTPVLPTLVALLLVGCGPTNDSLRQKLEGRARFDLNCEQIDLHPLEETNGYTTSYGVTGCNHRVTYVMNATTASWVMNVSDGTATKAGPEEAPPPPPPPPPH